MAVWVAMAVLAGSAAADEMRLDLSEGWRFKPGDDTAWSQAAFDDGGWSQIKVGVPWEEAGFPDLDGYAWYRLRVVIPAEWQELPSIRSAGGLVLDMGGVDDVDETFLNGQKIGKTGAFPPDYVPEWDTPRAYFIPLKFVKWGSENVVAVRVYDGQGAGGIWKAPVALRAPRKWDAIKLAFYPQPASGVVSTGKRLRVKIEMKNVSEIPVTGRLECSWRSDRLKDETVLGKDEREVLIKPGGTFRHAVEYRPAEAGFYRMNLVFKAQGEEDMGDFMVLGYEPEKVMRPLTKEADFDEFWAARLAELAAVAPEYTVEARPDKSTPKVDTYLVEMKSYGGVRVNGWLTVPKTKGPHAAVVMVPGYTSAMQPAVSRENMAVLALDIRGHGNSIKDLDPKGGEFMYIGLAPNPADYVYAGAYMDCIRAVDYLCSRPDIDPERIGVEGGSQGGGLSLATAALDPRIKACAPDVPWLCDWPDYLEVDVWTTEEFPKLLAKRSDLNMTKLMRILSYIDAMNLADRIKCPVNLSLGLRDTTCPPRTILAAYNRIKSKKEIHYYPFAGHGGGGGVHEDLKVKWLSKQLKARL